MEPGRGISLLTRNILLSVSLVALLACTSSAQVFMTKDEALKRLFPPGTRVEHKTLFLTPEQIAAIEARARAQVESKVISYYVGRQSDTVVGYAFFETHVVRTMPETFVLLTTPSGVVQAVEILAFYEPEDYLPPKRWLGLFRNKVLDDELWVKRGIQAISGATLSAQSITSGVRRLLATLQIAVPKENVP